jgi:hypothetical protein
MQTMNLKAAGLVLTLALALSGAAPAFGAPAPGTAADRAASFKFLIGTWHCTRTVNTAGASQAATMSETQVVTAHGSEWLHATQTITGKGPAGSTQDLFLGYNARHSQWVLVTLDSGGATEVETSSSPALNGSSWTVAFPSTSNGKSVFKKTSDNGYSSNSTWTSSKSGKSMTSTESCTRQ